MDGAFQNVRYIPSVTQHDVDAQSKKLALRDRLGFKRAAVAVARKLAVIMHSMLKHKQPARKFKARDDRY